MPAKKTKLEVVVDFPSEETLRPASGEDLRTLHPWRDGETVRAAERPHVSTPNSSTGFVWLEHRDHQGLGFKIELDRNSEVVSFVIRPVSFSIWSNGTMTELLVNEDAPAYLQEGPRLSSTLMRDLPFGQMRAVAAAALGRHLQFVGAEAVPRPKSGRKSSITDLQLARLSADWVDLLKAGAPKPMEALAAKHHLSYNGMVHRKRSAVERGLLTKTEQGRAGGALTEKALALIESASREKEKGTR
jgi:hypothetical protein